MDVHPLWEYSGIATSDKFEVLRFDFHQEPHDLKFNFEIPVKLVLYQFDYGFAEKMFLIHRSGTNGISLWMEWRIGNYTVTTGLKNEPQIGWRCLFVLVF